MTLHAPLDHGPAIDQAHRILLDVTRLVSSRWSGSQPTGLDRVAIAYARRLRGRALGVIQYRGLTRVLNARQSAYLFDLLLDPARRFRREFTWFATKALAGARGRVPLEGALYLNVGHTEFDSPEHIAWVARNKVRSVYFLHDLIPVRRPDLCRPAATIRHTARVTSALQGGAGIIVNSQATAADLAAYASESAAACPPVCVAPLASDMLKPAQCGKAAPGGVPYFLAVGTHEPRRNFALLLKVWARLTARLGDDVPKLKIVGQPWRHHAACFDELAGSDLHPRHLQLITHCPDEQLTGLVAGARALLMPTLAEGFGLPLVEALALGTPVIASDLPCLAESGKGIPLLLDSQNDEAWEQAIIAFHAGGAERERQLEMIGKYSPNTWDEHFARVNVFLEGLGQRSPRAIPVPAGNSLAS